MQYIKSFRYLPFFLFLFSTVGFAKDEKDVSFKPVRIVCKTGPGDLDPSAEEELFDTVLQKIVEKKDLILEFLILGVEQWPNISIHLTNHKDDWDISIWHGLIEHKLKLNSSNRFESVSFETFNPFPPGTQFYCDFTLENA